MATFSVGVALLNIQNFTHKEFENPSLLIQVWAAESILSTTEEFNKIVFNIFKFFSKLFVFAPYPFSKVDVVVFSDDRINTVGSYGLILMR